MICSWFHVFAATLSFVGFMKTMTLWISMELVASFPSVMIFITIITMQWFAAVLSTMVELVTDATIGSGLI